jgi:hypothetical protein
MSTLASADRTSDLARKTPSQRFTRDGSEELEFRLKGICQRISREVKIRVPPSRLQGLVLGGGYGRGEGGVLRTDTGDRPYNDLEFYLFLTGNRLWNERVYGPALSELGRRLSPHAGLHVEFKIDSLRRMRHSPVTIFSYDLIAAHRWIIGNERIFEGCEHHLDSKAIPLAEACRLLLNRCSGLLLARQLLTRPSLTLDQADFVGRNVAKAQLCLGDAVLVAFGEYHWSCIERHRRLKLLTAAEAPPFLEQVCRHHAAGVEFKLHPQQISKPIAEFEHERAQLAALALQVWLWLESRRLRHSFNSIREYALDPRIKWQGTARWRNYLLNLRTFGPKAGLAARSYRYPRERLLNALPLLLWNGELTHEPDLVKHLQKQLETNASDWDGLVTVYKHVWPQYG